jgi:phosphatidylserine decarboxylase
MPHSQTSAHRDSLVGARLARGASPWLLPTVATAAVSLVRARRSGVAKAVAVPATALAAGMLWFFRDPEREIAQGRVISPADGVVQSIMPWKDGRTRVAIFMSPLNVHVNRAPLSGTVTSVEHIPGGFVPAFNKESENNERVVWHFDTELGDIGLIRFGSRVDIYLPEGVEVAVEVGQKTVAGVTRIDRD